MKGKLLSGGMIAGMIVAWSCYYAASKVLVDAADSAFLAGFLLRASALVFLTIQLSAGGKMPEVLHPGKVVRVLLCIGVLGFLLDTFANLGYIHGDLGTGTSACAHARKKSPSAVRTTSARTSPSPRAPPSTCGSKS